MLLAVGVSMRAEKLPCLLALLLALGCSSPLEVGPPSFEGSVESVNVTPNDVELLIGDITPPPPLLEDDPRPELAGKKLVFVDSRARIYVRHGDGTVVPGSLTDIVVGSRIQVTTTGAEIRTGPPAYYARRIDVLR
jgi:hypothetical protein